MSVPVLVELAEDDWHATEVMGASRVGRLQQMAKRRWQGGSRTCKVTLKWKYSAREGPRRLHADARPREPSTSVLAREAAREEGRKTTGAAAQTGSDRGGVLVGASCQSRSIWAMTRRIAGKTTVQVNVGLYCDGDWSSRGVKVKVERVGGEEQTGKAVQALVVGEKYWKVIRPLPPRPEPGPMTSTASQECGVSRCQGSDKIGRLEEDTDRRMQASDSD